MEKKNELTGMLVLNGTKRLVKVTRIKGEDDTTFVTRFIKTCLNLYKRAKDETDASNS